MKKNILSILLLTATISTIFASPLQRNASQTASVQYSDISPFCKLIATGNVDAVKAMIESGADINEKSKGLTPLMFAARYNKIEIIKLLIENGANVKSKSKKGYTALKYAQLSKAKEAIALIEKALQK